MAFDPNSQGWYTGAQDPTQQRTPEMQNFWGQIEKQAGQGTQVDTNDPTFRQQADTYGAGVERSRRNAIADNAEQASAGMLGGSGAQAVANRGINESAQQQQGSFEANLAGRELQNKRAEIQQALQLAASTGNAEAQRTLTQQLGLIDSQLRQSGLDVQRYGIDTSAATQRYGIDANSAIASGQLGLGYANLGENSRQANNNLGYNYTALQQGANDSALRYILGGA